MSAHITRTTSKHPRDDLGPSEFVVTKPAGVLPCAIEFRFGTAKSSFAGTIWPSDYADLASKMMKADQHAAIAAFGKALMDYAPRPRPTTKSPFKREV